MIAQQAAVGVAEDQQRDPGVSSEQTFSAAAGSGRSAGRSSRPRTPRWTSGRRDPSSRRRGRSEPVIEVLPGVDQDMFAQPHRASDDPAQPDDLRAGAEDGQRSSRRISCCSTEAPRPGHGPGCSRLGQRSRAITSSAELYSRSRRPDSHASSVLNSGSIGRIGVLKVPVDRRGAHSSSETRISWSFSPGRMPVIDGRDRPVADQRGRHVDHARRTARAGCRSPRVALRQRPRRSCPRRCSRLSRKRVISGW